jgi:hypothetical protein
MSGLMGGLQDSPLPLSWRPRVRLTYPLTLATGQSFASKGGYLVKFAQPTGKQLAVQGDGRFLETVTQVRLLRSRRSNTGRARL